MIKVFYIERTDRAKFWLRRFAKGPCTATPGQYSYHNAMTLIGEGPDKKVIGDKHDHNDPRWPTTCACGYIFNEKDDWQLFHRTIYKRTDTGEEMTREEAPVGACYNAHWAAEDKEDGFMIGPDGLCLVVKTPGGDWYIDSRAGNCAMPNDNNHKCWVRHGNVLDGTLHVDKQGITCAAGAGSIAIGSYHGFLHAGFLTDT